MKNTALLFSEFKPFLFDYSQRIKNSHPENLPTFLFHGNSYTGKEWTAIKTLQFINCKDFLQQDHQILTCKICSRIQLLKMEHGIYSILSHIDTQLIEHYLALLERKIPLDSLSREDFVHELAKLSILLEAQFIKEQKSSPNKKFGITKLQEYTESISSLQNQLIQGNSSHVHPSLYSLIKEIGILSYDMSIEYVKYILQKIQTPNPHLHYRGLIIKDPVYLRNQPLLMNTLLKTVEESKKNLIIFFISEKKSKMLKTIQSRTTAIHFKAINPDYIENIKENSPFYFLNSLTDTVPQKVSSEEILDKTPIDENLLVQYLEQRKILYLGKSPLYQAKKLELERLILGLKEYRISPKNIQDILPFL